jgi:hypothetical protein
LKAKASVNARAAKKMTVVDLDLFLEGDMELD